MTRTRFTVFFRESHLSRKEVAGIFFGVTRGTTQAEEVPMNGRGVAAFTVFGFYNRVIETTLNRRLTDMDPLAELRINGQPYAARNLL